MVITNFEVPFVGDVFTQPLRIYTGLLGQIGDIICITATVRRVKELFPNSEITFAVSSKFREVGELVAGLPYIDHLFVTDLYFEKLTPELLHPFECGWPLELRGEDEIEEQKKHDLILETRPRHRRRPWWNYAHQVAEMAHMVGVPGPIDLQTDICIPRDTDLPDGMEGTIVIHNDPNIDPRKAWPWKSVQELVTRLGEGRTVLIGQSGPLVNGVYDLRGKTTLSEAARIIEKSACYIGIDSGLMWIASSLQVPTIGLYGTSYVPAYGAIHPSNPNAIYLQAEGDLDSIACDDVVSSLLTILTSKGKSTEIVEYQAATR